MLKKSGAAKSISVISGVLMLLLENGCSRDAADDFDNRVADTLKRKPELVKDALYRLASKTEREKIKSANEALLNNNSWLRGSSTDLIMNPAGSKLVTVVTDFQCQYCKLLSPKLFNLADKHPDVRLVFKDVSFLGPQSTRAAVAQAIVNIESANNKASYVYLMEQKHIDDNAIENAVEKSGISPVKLNDAALISRATSAVNNNGTLARKLAIEGTPAAIVNGEIFVGDVLPKIEAYISEN